MCIERSVSKLSMLAGMMGKINRHVIIALSCALCCVRDDCAVLCWYFATDDAPKDKSNLAFRFSNATWVVPEVERRVLWPSGGYLVPLNLCKHAEIDLMTDVFSINKRGDPRRKWSLSWVRKTFYGLKSLYNENVTTDVYCAAVLGDTNTYLSVSCA